MVNKKKKRKIATTINTSGYVQRELGSIEKSRVVNKKLLEHFDPILGAFDEVIDVLNALRSSKSIPKEINDLIVDTQQWIIYGLDRSLSVQSGSELEEARKILETEFLLLDFTHRDESLENWKNIEPWKRQQEFGFGKLRQREEKRQDLSEDMVIAARDYWIHHSTQSHPHPHKKNRNKVFDPSREYLLLICDLLMHSVSLIDSAISYVKKVDPNVIGKISKLSFSKVYEVDMMKQKVLFEHISPEFYEATRQPRPKNITVENFKDYVEKNAFS